MGMAVLRCHSGDEELAGLSLEQSFSQMKVQHTWVLMVEIWADSSPPRDISLQVVS